jgi:hypothetical protein
VTAEIVIVLAIVAASVGFEWIMLLMAFIFVILMFEAKPVDLDLFCR